MFSSFLRQHTAKQHFFVSEFGTACCLVIQPALLAYLTGCKWRRSVEFSTDPPPPSLPTALSVYMQPSGEYFGPPLFWSRPTLCYCLSLLLLLLLFCCCYALIYGLQFCFPWGLLDDNDGIDDGVVMWPYCLFSECFFCLFLARQLPSGPGPPYSWGL